MKLPDLSEESGLESLEGKPTQINIDQKTGEKTPTPKNPKLTKKNGGEALGNALTLGTGKSRGDDDRDNEFQQDIIVSGSHTKRKTETSVYQSHLPEGLPRILDPGIIPCKPYRRRSDSEKDVKHWGQRKLCLSEIEFLTDYLPQESHSDTPAKIVIVVYAGAAPGTHIAMLVDLFPQVHRWILVDPARFGLPDHPRVEKRREFFTDKLAADIGSRLRSEAEAGGSAAADARESYILFISDIRTANWKLMTRKANELQIATDNNDQMRWCQILQPNKAMLKFRLPYGEGSTFYLPGEIRFQVWAPPSSTETRLIPHSYNKMVPYKHLDYEQRLFFFNTEIRMKTHFPHSVRGPGLDNRYDSAAEVLILARYLERFNKSVAVSDTKKRIAKLSKRLSQLIGQSDEGLAGRLPESARRIRM